jgi:hypothetical protein
MLGSSSQAVYRVPKSMLISASCRFCRRWFPVLECRAFLLKLIFQKRRETMDSPEMSNKQENLRLRVAFFRWITCLGVFVLLVVLAVALDSSIIGYLAFFLYLGIGLYMNRTVLRKLIEWHPMYNTLYNVTSDKLRFFFLWPITYLFLFIRLGINKVL